MNNRKYIEIQGYEMDEDDDDEEKEDGEDDEDDDRSDCEGFKEILDFGVMQEGYSNYDEDFTEILLIRTQ